MDAVTEHGKRGFTEKVKDILPTHGALAPHVPAGGVFSPPSCVPDYAVGPTNVPFELLMYADVTSFILLYEFLRCLCRSLVITELTSGKLFEIRNI